MYMFQELLTRHKVLCAEFLEQNYDKVFMHYRKLLDSDNYVTKRQALKVRERERIMLPFMLIICYGSKGVTVELNLLNNLELNYHTNITANCSTLITVSQTLLMLNIFCNRLNGADIKSKLLIA